MFKILVKFFQKLKKALFCKSQEDVFYICTGSEILPEKLSNEEEQALTIKLGEGDENARTEFIERNLRLVVYTAQKFENTGVPTEDLISIGTIGLIKAVGSFNGEKKIKMATYASRCIENEILMHLRKTTKLKREFSLDEPLNTDKDGNELSLADVLGTSPDVVSKGVECEAEKNVLKIALDMLPDREREIMDMRYGLTKGREMTQKEVADKLEISQSYISRLEKRILEKLKVEMVERMKA
ncbi:MAG: RNA polymerase sporulation sigma factor SigK [Clostridia bacterium]|nr:RNA polymerase sporulation sigma factor SigK [Clostridia bacterium]